jgi:hypothetical protein
VSTPGLQSREPREAYVDARQLRQILNVLGDRMILIGGQALAFWASHYLLEAPAIAVTRDVDLLLPGAGVTGPLRRRNVDSLGFKEEVTLLAKRLRARALFPHERALTALVGQVVKDLADGNYINIDVLFRVHGDVTSEAIDQRAVDVVTGAGRFRVMHPLDVLQGRLENVYSLAEKQDDHGLAQLQVAIPTAREFLLDVAAKDSAARRPVVLDHIARIESMALSDAGRKVARRHHLHVADAIDPAPVAHVKAFTAKKLPQLLPLMSAARQSEVRRIIAGIGRP